VRVFLVDTGPLVALFDRRDKHHEWAVTTLQHRVKPPILTCDGVLTEATFLLRPGSINCSKLVEGVERELVRSSFALELHIQRVRWLMARYSSTPMSFADACLVRMTELHTDVVVWTTDTDFAIYRRHGRERIPTLMPTAS
jgi:predicted nucleic acid-binding protein